MQTVLSPAQQAEQAKHRSERRQLSLLVGPATVWLIAFFMLPLVVIFIISFLSKGTYGGVELIPTITNYIKLFDNSTFIIFTRSLWLAFLATIVCLIVGYPMAYVIARAPRRWRNILVLLVIIPFWTNFLVRTYAIMQLLRDEGITNTLLLNFNLISEALPMLYTPFAVFVGEVYGFLPFMVLPLYANIEKFDYALMEAAQDSGANEFWAFLRVMVPLTMPGIVAGSILVFIPAIGAFITPAILGGAKVLLIGNLIDRQFKTARNWPLASAMSIALMVLVSIATAIYFRTTNEQDRL